VSHVYNLCQQIHSVHFNPLVWKYKNNLAVILCNSTAVWFSSCLVKIDYLTDAGRSQLSMYSDIGKAQVAKIFSLLASRVHIIFINIPSCTATSCQSDYSK